MSMSDKKVAFLVDFDNVATDVIEQALNMVFKDYGAAHIRRAYCNAEQALREQSFLKRLGLRAIVNLAIGKNSTDIALAVDAMELAISEQPDVIVLVSSDSDFAPLVLRLREKGAWLRGFGQYGKTGDGVIQIYDQFNELAHDSGRAAPRAPARKTASGRAGAKKSAPAKPPVQPPRPTAPPAQPAQAATVPAPRPVTATPVQPVAQPVAQPAPRSSAPALDGANAPAVQAAQPAPATTNAKATPAPAPKADGRPAPKARAKAAPKPAPKAAPAAEPVNPSVAAAKEINAMLAACPKLADGQWHDLGATAKVLKEAGLLAKSAPSAKLFRKHPQAFQLQPEKSPTQVRFGHG